jgi:hypothetical protein
MSLRSFFGHRQPSERDCIVEAERRNMTVPIWEERSPFTGWRIIFARRDGTALLLLEPLFTDAEAFICPTVATASAVGADIFSAGYGTLPYTGLPALLDAFAIWDGADALAELFLTSKESA